MSMLAYTCMSDKHITVLCHSVFQNSLLIYPTIRSFLIKNIFQDGFLEFHVSFLVSKCKAFFIVPYPESTHEISYQNISQIYI